MDFFKPRKLGDIVEFSVGMAVRWTTRLNNHPMKTSSRWFSVEQDNMLYKNNGLGGLILSYEVDQLDSYSGHKKVSITHPTNEWLLDPNHDIDVFQSVQFDGFMFDEQMLDRYLQGLEHRKAFHDSHFFKFDIDGYENTDSGYRHSHFKSQFSKETAEYRSDGLLYVSQETLHRPFALRIAKFVKPRIVECITGDYIEVTHITELGELIYDIDGLKCVDKKMLKKYYVDRLYVNYNDIPTMADSLEESISGDIPQYRPDFSISIAARYFKK